MKSIFLNLRTEKQYKASTGLNKKQFNELLSVFEKYYQPKKKSPIKNTLPPVLTDKSEALFFVLHYLKSYPTLENMGIYFGMDVRTVSDYLTRTKAALRSSLLELKAICWTVFKGQEEFDKAFEGVEDIVFDCTEISVNRPKGYENQELVYSGKKNSIP